jgi:hypothetical protein
VLGTAHRIGSGQPHTSWKQGSQVVATTPLGLSAEARRPNYPSQLSFLLKRDGTRREGTLVSGRENAEMDRAHESDVDGHAGLWLLGRPSSKACVLALARRAAIYTSFYAWPFRFMSAGTGRSFTCRAKPNVSYYITMRVYIQVLALCVIRVS